ncbi:DUF2341 domain-containing protein [Candidatus Gottesmanbacteria bacterium]|nr:DUF2341 domain-containing protein [Candidatus Gottesmanbacteria bacterium]
MEKHRLFAIFLGILLGATSFWWIPLLLPRKTEAVWFNDNWGYRQIVAITNSGSNQTDYQVGITLDTATLITAGKMQSDCDDVRVTDVNGKVLPHVIEEGSAPCNNASTKIWTMVPSIPTSGINVYVYYGNPSAVSVENGGAVFTFFDNFNGTTIDDDVWTPESNLAYTISGGVLEITSGSIYLDNSLGISFADGYIAETRLLYDAVEGVMYGGVLEVASSQQVANSNANSDAAILYMRDQNSQNVVTFIADGSAASWNVQSGPLQFVSSDSTYYILGTGVGSSSVKLYKDGSVQNTYSSITWSKTMSYVSLGRFTTGTNVSDTTYDWIRVRKFAATEPSVGSPSSEEKGPGPIGYWKLDEGYGTTANDGTSNSNEGTLTNGPTWVAEDMCVSGKCLEFDGSDDYIFVGDPSDGSLDMGTDDFSISGWLRTGTDASQTIVEKGATSDSIAGYWFLYAAGAAADDLQLSIGDGVTRVNADSKNGLNLTDNKWHHFAVTADRDGVASFYVDGQNVGDEDISSFSATSISTSRNLTIGRNATFTPDGFLDDVKIYRYVRTRAQVKADYAAGKAGIGLAKPAAGVLGADSDQKNQTLSQGLVGYWKMDESVWTPVNCSGTPVLDSSGNSHNGRSCPDTTGPTGGAVGKFGYAGDFDGTEDFIRVPETTALDISGAMTVAAWIKFDTSQLQGIISHEGNSLNNGYALDMTSGNVARFHISDADNVQYYSGDSQALSTGTWYHIVGVYIPSVAVQIYVNGALVNQNTTSIPSTQRVSTLLFTEIAIRGNEQDFFDGKIDEARIYNRAFQPSEVSLLYNFAPGPVGYWKMEEGSGTTANDTSGNANTGTLQDSTTWSAGKYGKSLTFDASGDYVKVDDSTSLDITGTITMEAWVNRGSLAVGNFPLAITKENYAGGSGYLLGDYHAGNDLMGCRINGNTDTTNGLLQESTATYNEWVHYACTFDGTTISLYKNGILLGTKTPSFSTITANNEQLRIGPSYSGYLDEAKVYNYARTQKQIIEDMNAGHPAVGSPVGSAVGYWKLDEGQGTTANNSGNQGSALNGTLINMASPATATSGWTNTGKFAKALVFDGSNDYVNLGQPTALNLTENMTVSAWFTTNDLTTLAFVYAQCDSSGTGGQIFIDIGRTDNEITVGWGNTVIDTTTVGLQSNRWYHLAVVRTGVSGNWMSQIYINGLLNKQKTSISTDPGSILDNHIGSCQNTSTNWEGKIDEVKVYNYALTSDEVKLDYNRSAATVLGTTTDDQTAFSLTQGLVGYWKFDESSGDASDSSGNATTLTNTNSATYTAGKYYKAGTAASSTDACFSAASNSYLASGGNKDYTISFWSVRTANPASDRFVAAKSDKGTNGSTSWEWYFVENNLSGPGFVVSPDGTLASVSSVGTNTITLNTWFFTVAWYDSKAGTINIQYDNGPVQSTAFTSGIYNGTNNFTVGCIQNVSSVMRAIDGKVDEFRIYKRVLSPSERAYLYTSSIQNLVAEWKLDEGTGTTAYDTSGQESTSKNFKGNLDWTGGKFGSSMNFLGSNSEYIGFSDATAFDLGATTESYSVSAWMKTTTNFSANAHLVAKYDGGAAYPFILYLNTSEQACFTLRGTNNPIACGSTALNDGNWHNLVGVRDVVADTIYTYVDGILATSTTDTTTATAANNASLTIGNGGTSYTTFDYTGQIDQVQIYNLALTQYQISQIYNRGGPIGWWKFDECEGTTANDSSGNGNNGTIVPGSSGTTAVGNCQTSATSMWYDGRIGKRNSSLDFDGTDDYVMIGTVSMYELTTASFTAWIYREGTCSFDDCVIVGNGPGGNTGYTLDIASESGPPYVLRMDIRDLQKVYGKTTLATNTWYHVAGSFDGSYIRLWVNGKLETIAAQTQTPTYANPTKIGLGNSDIPFNGDIDDVRIYNYVLTDDQVMAIMNEGAVRWGPISGTP